MPFSHHSHSGQFCLHAKDKLEEIVKEAISKGMETLVLTEHMPRDQEGDIYPEEIEAGASNDDLFDTFSAYHAEARRLQEAYSSAIQILVGTEIDWIRPSSRKIVEDLIMKYPFDTLIGSIHHVHTIPIDFDRLMYERARHESGGADEMLFADYFDAQLAMLEALRPPIVGHFDLIRLKSDAPNVNFMQHSAVWEKIVRNLKFISEYGGILEVDSAALRKGMTEPYPQANICLEFLKLGGDFVLSDDSHAVNQVGYGYDRTIRYIESLGIKELVVLERGTRTVDSRFPRVSARRLLVRTLWDHAFFKRLP